MTTPDLETLSGMIRDTAKHELLPHFARIHQDFKLDGSIVTEADRRMQQTLQDRLRENWPQIAFLGEEMSPQAQQKALAGASQGVWVVDPLDGTSNFSLGIPFFAVSLALILDGRIELGVVYDPIRDECFCAQRGAGARLNNHVLSLEALSGVERMTIGLVDFKRLDQVLVKKLISEPPYMSQRSFGSVALDWCWIAAGRGDVYIHGKQKLWDYAAGHIILSEAGGVASTIQGEAVYNGSLDPRSAVLAINQPLFDKWLAYLNAV